LRPGWTTELRVEGEYERPEEPGHGYSRDKWPDLKQVVALLTTYKSLDAFGDSTSPVPGSLPYCRIAVLPSCPTPVWP